LRHLGDDKKNRALEQLVIDFTAQLARYTATADGFFRTASESSGGRL
jgi:hypothetical protein